MDRGGQAGCLALLLCPQSQHKHLRHALVCGLARCRQAAPLPTLLHPSDQHMQVRSARARAAHLGVQVGQSREAGLQHVPRGALLLHLAPAALELLIQVAPCTARQTCRFGMLQHPWGKYDAETAPRLQALSPCRTLGNSMLAERHKLHACRCFSPHYAEALDTGIPMP